MDSFVQSEVCPLFFALGSTGALVAAMEAAGFSHVQERRMQTVLSFESSERLLSAMIDAGAVALAAKRLDDATRRALDEQFLASVTAYRKGGRFEIPGEFVIASGVC